LSWVDAVNVTHPCAFPCPPQGPQPPQPLQYVPWPGQVRKIHLSRLKLPPAPLGIFYELTLDYHTCVADERVNIYAPDGKLLVALIPGMSRFVCFAASKTACLAVIAVD
jgi:hypothetical protein